MLFGRPYETLQQQMHESLSCIHCWINIKILTYH